MSDPPENPLANRLGSGLTEEMLRSAVEESGYPLQTFVGNVLRDSYSVDEEWAYIDRDSGEVRTMDMHAWKFLFDWNNQPRVRPTVNLLIECKQSDLPYVFFKSDSPQFVFDHPVICGLGHSGIEIATDDSGSTWVLPVINALGLHDHDFQRAPRFSKTFSKCVRKGAKVELSGTDAYSHLILPLVKALSHFRTDSKPPDTAVYFDAHTCIGLGVLDAPMVIATSDKTGTALEFSPWVRIARHDYEGEEGKPNRHHYWVIDIVHKDFLRTYVDSALGPFVNDFGERVLRHTQEIATGRGFASGMEADSWNGLDERLKPKR